MRFIRRKGGSVMRVRLEWKPSPRRYRALLRMKQLGLAAIEIRNVIEQERRLLAAIRARRRERLVAA